MSSVIKGTVHTHTGNVKSPTIVRYFPVSRNNTHDNRFKGKNGKFLRVLAYKRNDIGGHLKGHVIIMDIDNWSKKDLLVFSILYPNSMDSLSRKNYKWLLLNILDMDVWSVWVGVQGEHGIKKLLDDVIETQKKNMVKHESISSSEHKEPLVKEDRKKTLIDNEKKVNLDILNLEKQIQELEKNKKKIKNELKKIEKKEKKKKKKQEIQATMYKLAEQLKALEKEELEEEELEEEELEVELEVELDELLTDDDDELDEELVIQNFNYQKELEEIQNLPREIQESKHDGKYWGLVDGEWTSMSK